MSLQNRQEFWQPKREKNSNAEIIQPAVSKLAWLAIIYCRNFLELIVVYVHLLLQSLQSRETYRWAANALNYIELRQKKWFTFSSSSNEIFFGLYASIGPVLDSAFLVSIISHSWSSFTFAISLLNYKEPPHLRRRRGKIIYKRGWWHHARNDQQLQYYIKRTQTNCRHITKHYIPLRSALVMNV